MVAATGYKHHTPGYTGFLPGGQHQMAKTYGQASEACLKERQANADPLKWRKFVSYAEFTPAHTPAEEHHLPGYCGHVPGVYSENLFAKTYGKTTLTAIQGQHPKGCEQSAAEQFKTSSQKLSAEQVHPGKPRDIMSGGSSWTGASPYNIIEAADSKELAAVAPWPPSTVQIAGGKEPPQPSPLLKNYPATAETTEPALKVTGKMDPHDANDPAKKTMSVTKGNFHIPGYSGFVAGVMSENLYAGTYATITSAADEIRDRKVESAVHLDPTNVNEEGVLPLTPAMPPKLTTGDMTTTAVDGPNLHAKHVPGYTGFVPGVQAENIYKRTYGHATNIAIGGDHTRFQWREQEPGERFITSGQTELKNFGHPAKIQDGHVTYAHTHNNPARANYEAKKPPSANCQMPGYGGFVPGVQSRNMFAMTQLDATTKALADFSATQAASRAASAPSLAKSTEPELGMLQFKPSGFLYQKRMQGEWNNGMLGSRNYSAVKLSEGNIWKGGTLYKTTSAGMHPGHKNCDAPHVYSKGPEPTFQNMDFASNHKSLFLGYYAL